MTSMIRVGRILLWDLSLHLGVFKTLIIIYFLKINQKFNLIILNLSGAFRFVLLHQFWGISELCAVLVDEEKCDAYAQTPEQHIEELQIHVSCRGKGKD